MIASIILFLFSLSNGLTIRRQTTDASKLLVGIGDSWTSGDGGGSVGANGRSPNAYPLVAAKILNWEGKNLARGGSKINDIAAQLKTFSTLPFPPTHIVVGTGGNDLGVAEALIQVTLLNNLAAVSSKLITIKPRLVSVYKDIQKYVPTAKVYAVPYPNFVGNSNKLPNESKCRLMMELLTTTIKEAAAEANIGYIDVSGAFKGHEMYSEEPFIWGLFDKSAAHPNQKGYTKMGEIVAAHLQAESN
ncbi:unnamed protein product [Adineta steineri]|uniref:SGNH hydrolase-type esterase domain-containing protein n=1 Tax=Adineta steineri TaxID=433720 RepID=A0A814JE50_9BILA|nr:unnamed protein product [Adineta steineri]